MATCEVCGQEMNTAGSCEVTSIGIEGVEYDLIPYGQETRFGRQDTAPSTPSDTRCHDCGVLVGGFHHVGCDFAECPRCHGQMMTCDCLSEFDEHDEGPSNRDKSIEDLFLDSPNQDRITYKGQEVVRFDRFPLLGAGKIRVVCERADSDWSQAVMLESESPMEIDGDSGHSHALWAEGMPSEVIVTCDPREESVSVYNAWEPGIPGELELGLGSGGMIIEEIPGGRRYRCNDGEEDDDFEDLIFTIERHTETPK